MQPRLVLQKVFLLVPIGYLLSLSGVAFLRSSQRHSVVTSAAVSEGGTTGEVSEQATSSSKVQLQEFHRVEVKHGRPVWEIRAKDAKYYPQDFVTHVNGAELTIFREKKDNVVVTAEAAKLYLGGSNLVRAVLDGNIGITIQDGLVVKTDAAEFDASAKVFSANGQVAILGTGFDVEGQQFRYDSESGIMSFGQNVHCMFQPHAEIPKGLSLNGK
ncbi:MAG: LPS export ABC transporter periplasmic protein LptC [Bdellovibrionota bacterium]